jgi:putative addiction module component (TIGR02574 family)
MHHASGIKDLGLDRLSLEDRLQLAEAIWDRILQEVESKAYLCAELKRRIDYSEIILKV